MTVVFLLNLVTYFVSSSNHFASPVFAITQHSNNLLLLKSFSSFFPDISIKKKSNDDCVRFMTSSKNYFLFTIIPFFNTYPLYGVKSISLYKIKLILNLINGLNPNNLKIETKDQIREIWSRDDIRLLGDATPEL